MSANPTDSKASKKTSPKEKKLLNHVTVRIAGDSGDGMQLAGDQFTDTTAVMGNDFATLPDYPAEIRAPAGTLPGVSSFQIQFSGAPIYTPGDIADVLVAMNPAALKVNIPLIRKGGLIIINESIFNDNSIKKAGWKANPLTDDTLKDYQVVKVPLSELTRNALADHPIKSTEVERCKNFFALGILFWLYDRTLDYTVKYIEKRFAKRPDMVAANIAALKGGYNYADIVELFPSQYSINIGKLEPGTYRKISGNEATAIGFITAAKLANKTLFYGSYPITPASDILHFLSRHKQFGIKTFQAEDEIAAIGSAIGAAFGGQLGICGTSGPGVCLKAEALNLAVMTELPLVVIDVQRSGPSTGMPTKPEQGDLLMAMYGRNSESPIAILAPKSPSDCFNMAIEAIRIAVQYMTPVMYLSDGYLANSSEPWKLPEIDSLSKIPITHPKSTKEVFLPYTRDSKTLARPWAIPGTAGLEHRIGGLSKADLTGNVSYDPENHQKMINLRAEKVRRIADSIPDVAVYGAESGNLLVLSWGGTYGAVYQAILELEKEKKKIGYVHLNYLNPFPKNLGEIIKRYKRVLIPELNMGQLIVLMRNQFPDTNFIGFNKVKGLPFQVHEVVDKIKEVL